jgi:hypothetical protein
VTGESPWAGFHGGTFLADGRVLVLWVKIADEYADPPEGPSRSGLYDSKTDTWTEFAPPWDYQIDPRGCLSVVGLADGNALAVLSSRSDDAVTRTQSALFDAGQRAWLAPVDLPINEPISVRDGARLSDGRVLMFGAAAGTYLYDPATASWDTGPKLPFDDLTTSCWTAGHGAALLDDGTVIALSPDGHSARLPPGDAAWQRSGMAAVGDNAYLVAIPGGAVALGGTLFRAGDIHSRPDPRIAVYRADTHRWSPGPDAPPLWDGAVEGPGSGSVGVLLADGRVLAAGGWGAGTDYSCMSGAAILSADAQSWQSIEPMPACLGFGIGQLRADGSILIVGEGDAANGGIGILVLGYLP